MLIKVFLFIWSENVIMQESQVSVMIIVDIIVRIVNNSDRGFFVQNVRKCERSRNGE